MDSGAVRDAFELFFAAAKADHLGAQVNLGFLFDTGTGVEKNREKAMYWYRKAARRGEASAANNIGTIFRDEGKWRLSLRWFEKAIELGSAETLLEVAKLWAGPLNQPLKAKQALTTLLEANDISEVCEEEAMRLKEILEKQGV